MKEVPFTATDMTTGYTTGAVTEWGSSTKTVVIVSSISIVARCSVTSKTCPPWVLSAVRKWKCQPGAQISLEYWGEKKPTKCLWRCEVQRLIGFLTRQKAEDTALPASSGYALLGKCIPPRFLPCRTCFSSAIAGLGSAAAQNSSKSRLKLRRIPVVCQPRMTSRLQKEFSLNRWWGRRFHRIWSYRTCYLKRPSHHRGRQKCPSRNRRGPVALWDLSLHCNRLPEARYKSTLERARRVPNWVVVSERGAWRVRVRCCSTSDQRHDCYYRERASLHGFCGGS